MTANAAPLKTLACLAPVVKLALLSGVVAFSACRSGEANLETYYVVVGGVPMAIPAAYAHTEGFGSGSPDYADAIRVKAAKPPGVAIDSISIRIFRENAEPASVNASPFEAIEIRLGVYRTVSISTAVSKSQQIPVPIAAPTQITLGRRIPSLDTSGLAAYSDGPDRDIDFRASNMKFSMRCSGFGLPNPMCEARTTWRETPLSYSFQYAKRAEWEKVNGKVLGLLNSFAVN
jgi:hypothetical protein